MEDYRIERELLPVVTKTVAGGNIALNGNSTRVGLYVWTNTAGSAQVFFPANIDGQPFWQATADVTSRYFSIKELGQLMCGAINIEDGVGGASITVVETLLKRL